MTVTVPGLLLLREPGSDRMLAGFADPNRDLSLDRPCYIPAYSVRFEPCSTVNADTGEYHDADPGTLALGYGLFQLPDPVWDNLVNLVAADIRERERQDRIKDLPTKPKRDRLLTPERAAKLKAQRRQGSLF